jgi:hypothetical protein
MVTLCWIDIDRLGRNLNHLHRADIKERIIKERMEVIGMRVIKGRCIESRLSLYERLFTKERDTPGLGGRVIRIVCVSVCMLRDSEGVRAFLSVPVGLLFD